MKYPPETKKIHSSLCEFPTCKQKLNLNVNSRRFSTSVIRRDKKKLCSVYNTLFSSEASRLSFKLTIVQKSRLWRRFTNFHALSGVIRGRD